MIKKIKLINYRKFQNLEIDIEKDIVVFHGDNAVGKSTILEAISLITNGKSPWATADEYISTNQKDETPFCRIEITINDDKDEKTYSYYKTNSRRILKINDKNIPIKKFFEEEGQQKNTTSRIPHPVDSDYWKLFTNFPKCSGVALGFDRLLMLLTKRSTIDAVIPFPLKI